MILLNDIWLVLLMFRGFLTVANVPSLPFTILISGLQLCQLIMFMQKRNFRLFSYAIPLLIITVLVAYNPATLATFNILLAIILLKNEKFEHILNIAVCVSLLQIFMHIGFLCTGILQDKIISMPKGSGHTFGYSNTNGPGEFYTVTAIIFSLFILTKTKFRFLNYFLIIPVYAIYKLSMGRTYFYAGMLYFLCLFIFKRKFFARHFRKIYFLIPFILLAATLVLCKIYEQYPILDVVFTTRFSKNSVYLNSMTPLNYLLGYKLPQGEPMDSAFLAQLFAGGITSVYIFLSMYFKGCVSMKADVMKKYFPFILFMLASGFTENSFSTFCIETVLFYKILGDCFEFDSKFYKNKYWRPANDV